MSTTPEITPEMIEQAKQFPNGYVYCIDPAYTQDEASGVVPPQDIIGAYPVDAEGTIIPEFQANPNYIPR